MKNTALYLPKCLNSILNQTIKEIEIICVDNESKDDSPKILEEYKKRHNNIIVLSCPHGRLGHARNIGLKDAKGEYIGFVDSDDFIHREMYKKMYAKASSHDADMAICGITTYYQKDNKYIKKEPGIFKQKEVVHISENKYLFRNLTSCNKLYRRKFIDRNQLRFPENLYYEDQLYVIEAYILANKIACIPQPYYYYRKQRENQISTLKTDQLFDVFKVFKELDKFIEENNSFSNDISEIKIQRLLYLYNYINRKDRLIFYNKMKKEINKYPVNPEFNIVSNTEYKNSLIIRRYPYLIGHSILTIRNLLGLFLGISFIKKTYLKFKDHIHDT